jgi:hypothetical protein
MWVGRKENRTLGETNILGWGSPHLKNPKMGFFGWCSSECCVIEAIS